MGNRWGGKARLSSAAVRFAKYGPLMGLPRPGARAAAAAEVAVRRMKAARRRASAGGSGEEVS